MPRALNPPATDAAELRAARYSSVAIVMHWAVAVLVLGQVALGWRMAAEHGSTRFVVFQLHKSIGITILLMVVLRLAWRLYQRPPAAIGQGWERVLAAAIHLLLYMLLLALPVSGWIIISTSRIVVPTLLYGVVPWPHFPGIGALASAARAVLNDAAEFAHLKLVFVLCGLFALHVAGALKHQLIDRDHTIARMAPGVRPGTWADPRLGLIALAAGLAVALGHLAPLGLGRPGAVPLPAPPPSAARSVAHLLDAPIISAAPASAPAPIVATRAQAVAIPASTSATVIAPVSSVVPSWTVLPGSTLLWATTWSGDTINGGFKRFDSDIVFDPDQLARSHVVIRVHTSSVFSGNAQRDATLTTADWFACGTNPVATFLATSFRNTAPGHFVAAGTLSLKGVKVPIQVAFSLVIKGNTAMMRGTAEIDRTAFEIGEGEFAATTEIPAAVILDIAIKAKQQ